MSAGGFLSDVGSVKSYEKSPHRAKKPAREVELPDIKRNAFMGDSIYSGHALQSGYPGSVKSHASRADVVFQNARDHLRRMESDIASVDLNAREQNRSPGQRLAQ